MRAYKVTVKTTDGARDTTSHIDPKTDKFIYDNCEDGELFVVTDDPRKIYDRFKDAVISIKDIGVGYSL